MDKTEVTNECKTSVPIENRSIKKSIPPDTIASHSTFLKKLSIRINFKINKPVIPLKITLFLWFGAAATLQPFVGLHLKQLGLSVKNLSIIYMISPFFRLAGTAVSGIIADKIGSSKPVLQANLIFTMIAASSMLFIPELKPTNCKQGEIHCSSEIIDYMKMTTYCSVSSNDSRAINCSFHCPLPVEDFCFQNYSSSCGVVLKHNWSSSVDYKIFATCVEELPAGNNATNDLWCRKHKVKKCSRGCKENTNLSENQDMCKSDEDQTKLFTLSCILLIAFGTFLTCCYRILDVTSMSMIKTYNSDFGTQRIWSILGLSICAPVSGYLITLTNSNDLKQKYDVAFYMFDAMILLTICAAWRLDVKIEPPAKDMLRKLASVLKNLDIMVFLVVVLVIGTNFGFEIKYGNWYLQELNASNSLIGLLSAVSGLVGVPFLVTSKWFVTKLGSSNLLILALLGHAAHCTSYSFMQNPWWSLPCEVFTVLTYHILWVAVVTHTYEAAPTGLTSVVVSAAGGMHYTLGIGAGSLIGGLTMAKYGGRIAFRLMAEICVGTAVLYVLYLLCRRRIWKRELNLENTENKKSDVCEIPERFSPQVFFP